MTHSSSSQDVLVSEGPSGSDGTFGLDDYVSPPTCLFSNALNLWVSKMIWRTRALLPVLDALAQGIGPTGIKGRLAIWGVGRVTNVNTGAILAILFFFAIFVSSTAWQAFAIYLLSASMVTLALSLTDNSNWFARLTGFLINTMYNPLNITSLGRLTFSSKHLLS